MNKKTILLPIAIIFLVVGGTASLSWVVKKNKTPFNEAVKAQVIDEAATLSEWAPVVATKDEQNAIRPLYAVDMDDFIKNGKTQRDNFTRAIAGRFKLQMPIVLDGGPFAVALPFVQIRSSVEQPYAVVVYMARVDLKKVDLLRQRVADGIDAEFDFQPEWLLTPFAITRQHSVAVVHATFRKNFTLEFDVGRIALFHKLDVTPAPSPVPASSPDSSPVSSSGNGDTAPAPPAMAAPETTTPVSAEQSAAEVKIYDDGESLPAGTIYTVPQLAALSGRHFEPLTAYLRSELSVYKVGKRLWWAKPATNTGFGFSLSGTTRIQIAIPFDTPAALIGKTLQISATAKDPLELLSVEKENGNFIVKTRMRRRIEINK